MIVALATSLTTYIPMMSVPNFEVGEKVIAELKEISPDDIFTLVSGSDYSNIEPFTKWDWKFLH